MAANGDDASIIISCLSNCPLLPSSINPSHRRGDRQAADGREVRLGARPRRLFHREVEVVTSWKPEEI